MEQKNNSELKKVINSYLFSILMSIIFSPLFGKFYLFIFKPFISGGLGGYDSLYTPFLIQSAIFAYLFFLPLIILILVLKKRWLIWSIGIFIPFTMVLVGGSKHLLWFIIFTIAGGLMGWLINLGIKRFKKAK